MIVYVKAGPKAINFKCVTSISRVNGKEKTFFVVPTTECLMSRLLPFSNFHCLSCLPYLLLIRQLVFVFAGWFMQITSPTDVFFWCFVNDTTFHQRFNISFCHSLFCLIVFCSALKENCVRSK